MVAGCSLDPEQRRKSVVMSYVTTEQKDKAARLARAAEMTQSDLVRLFLVTATPEDVERLKAHPDYLALIMEESIR
jgi:hypothetical protein